MKYKHSNIIICGLLVLFLVCCNKKTEDKIEKDGKTIVQIKDKIIFIKKFNKKIIQGTDEVNQTELWLSNSISGHQERLVPKNTNREIFGIMDLNVSIDENNIYYTIPEWVTSSALYVYKLNEMKNYFICPVLSYSLITNKKHNNYLRVLQRRQNENGIGYSVYDKIINLKGETLKILNKDM